MVFNQIVANLDGQLIRSERIRQRGALRIAFRIQMLHVLKIRAITADAHVQAIADIDGVDLTRINLAKLRHLLLQALMRLVGGLGRTIAGTEVEAGQPRLAGLMATSNLVEAGFHIGGELVIHILRELRFEQFGDGERQPGRDQRTATLVHVPAVDDCGDDARIRGRTADFLLFQRFDERRFGVARRRLGLVAVRGNVHGGKLVARLHRRQGNVVIGFLRSLRRLFGLIANLHARRLGALLRVGNATAALAGGLHEAGEFDDGAGRLEHGLAVGFGRRGQTHGGGGTGRIGHLAGQRALPDQGVQLELVGRHFGGDFSRIAEMRARRSDTFVGFLRARRLRGVLLGRIGQVLFAEVPRHRFTGGRDRLLRQRHRIGTHIRDETVFVQPLRGTHGLARAHAKAIAGRLLQRGRGERRHRTATVRLGFHRRDGERRIFQRSRDRIRVRFVQLHDVVFDAGGGQLAIIAEILGTGQTTAAKRHHARIERNIVAVGVGRFQRGGDIPIGGTHERHALTLTFHDQTGGHGLHAARGQARTDLAPQHRGQLIAVQTVQNTTGFLGVHHGGVHITRVVQRRLDRFRRDLVEHHALDGHLRLQRLHKMPCDRLTFAILISGEVEGVCLLQRAFQVGNGFLLVAVHDVIRLESVFDIHAELAVLGFLGRRHLAGLGKVADMADRCHDRVSGAQVSANLLRLGRRLHNNELAAGSHSHSLLLVFATQ